MEAFSGSEDLPLQPDLDFDLDLDNSLFNDPAWLDSLLSTDSLDIDFDPHPSLSPSQDSFTPPAADFDDKEEENNVRPFSSSPSSSSSTTTTTAPTAQGNLPKSAFSDGNDEEAKRNARLMRNRESAQLSRQRKKNYIDELEEKVKSANSTIAELNNTVAYLSSENVKLKQQLAALNPNANPLPCYPSWAPPFPYPSYPLPAVTPAGRVPLLPIPRLKSSPPSCKPRKQPLSKTQQHNENPNPSKRVKKLASVAFLGFFFFIIFLVGGMGTFRANVTELSPGLHMFNGGGRVLTSWEGNNSTVTNNKAVNNHIYDFDRGKGKVKEEILNSVYPQNFSEPLVASLFVPRNDKLVKIDGNLIIHAVLAGEKALKSNKEDIVSVKRESEKNSLALITERHRALAVARAAGPNLEIQKQLFEGATENQRALASNPKNDYREDMQPTSADRSLQQWFREGLAGPVLGSGMCTEVFQFDASPNSPATTINSRIMTTVSSSVANGSVEQSRNNSSGSKINEARRLGQINNLKNRRVSYAVPLPPARPPLNATNERNMTDRTERIHEDRGYQRKPSSMVVSVLVDPRETGDEGMLSSGRLSRIFVVVLIDRVKYVTYSCVVPSHASVPHLARN